MHYGHASHIYYNRVLFCGVFFQQNYVDFPLFAFEVKKDVNQSTVLPVTIFFRRICATCTLKLTDCGWIVWRGKCDVHGSIQNTQMHTRNRFTKIYNCYLTCAISLWIEIIAKSYTGGQNTNAWVPTGCTHENKRKYMETMQRGYSLLALPRVCFAGWRTFS